MLMERTLKTEILTHFTKKIAVKKEQRDPRVVSLCQSTWPHEVTATLEVQNATKRTRCVYNGYNKSQFHNDERKPSCAAHTVPYIDRHWGPAALQHEEQVVLMRKKKRNKMQKAMRGNCRSWIQSPRKCRTSLLLTSVCGPVALGGDCSFYPFFSQSCPVQFTICRWKNVDVELPNVNACS